MTYIVLCTEIFKEQETEFDVSQYPIVRTLKITLFNLKQAPQQVALGIHMWPSGVAGGLGELGVALEGCLWPQG
jgi:hypothetical protein